MLRNFSKGSSVKSSSSAFSRLRSSLQTCNPNSDRLNESRSKLRQTMKSNTKKEILKSSSQRKLKPLFSNKQNCIQSRSSSLRNMLASKTLKSCKDFLNYDCPNKSLQKTSKKELNQQYQLHIDKLDHSKHIHIGQLECFLDYKSFVFIMTEMNYLNLWKEDHILLNEMWRDLGGEDYGGFLKSNLILFLQIIEGITFIEEGHSLLQNRQNNGSFKKADLYNQYERLRTNKLNSRRQSTETKLLVAKQNQIQNSQNINKNSSKSEKWSLKIRQQLQNQGKSQIKIRKKMEVKKSQKVRRVSFQLDQVLALKDQNDSNKKNVCKSINVSQNNSPFRHSSVSKQQEVQVKPFRNIRIPLLSLDINLGHGKTQKLIIYEGDSSKQISQQLGIKHQLDKETCLKFQQILQSHLKHLLSKIEQVEQLTEDMSCSHREV